MTRARSVTAEAPPPEAAAALREGARLRLLGLLFERPRPAWREEVASLAAEVPDEALRAAAALARDAEEGAYLAALGPGGAVSPREAAVRRDDPGKLLAEIVGYYQAFAYRPQAEDPPDHLAVEAGFVAYLHLKEAYALATGDALPVETTREARTRFVDEHLAPLAQSLAERVPAGAPPHLRAAAELLASHAGGARWSDGPVRIILPSFGTTAAAPPAPDDDEPRCCRGPFLSGGVPAP